ncbi:MAG: hypothetical protein K2H18_05230, partial [Muribaculaceae bacterium]|nr:hypothetical protein [Muribaculaceae bacterium]
LIMYQKPIKFLGKSGKLSSWYDGKFKGMIETPDGVIAIKNNGDTYLNDEKIGNTKVSISNRMDSMGFCTYTLVGKFNGENGETDSFSASNRMFIP